ncbi:hypothetical protein NHL50_17500 [Acidimicrobiia bacterium EGI L10123]|uniref:hypothetical protein n=1 Tax=Salinilacustrithrix flava TaxID=2957203 RepID=UPI003D7C3247|nr:hypothetical protein [Acidimicrobiia bacterium EGI L10123]
MSPRGVAISMLAVSGVAVGHIVGYGVAHPQAAAREAALGGHAYLPAAATVAIPLGVVAALAWAIRTSRQLGLAGAIPFRTLALAQLGVFAVQEVGERVAVGDAASGVLTERGVWFGLLAQVAVAYLITRSIDAVRRVVRLLTGGGRVLRDLVCPPVSIVPVVVRVQRAVAVSVGLRAPPVVGAR